MPPNTLASPAQNKTTHEHAILIAADICRVFEGFRAKPYLCPAGVPTIGYGSTRYQDGSAVALSDKGITRLIGETMLLADLAKLAPWVLALCPGLRGQRLAAILDFAYNLGVGRLRASTLRKRINAREWDSARAELLKWNKGGGKILPGLVKRRTAEAALLTASE